MTKAERESTTGFFIAVLIGAAIAFCGSYGGRMINGTPVFASAVAGIFLIQWIAFVPAFLFQTEKFYDLVGSLTFISATAFASYFSSPVDVRSLLLTALVVVWAGRLGSFLFRRIHKAGKDSRFDDIKPSFVEFLLAWTLQGLWVSVTLGAALAAIASTVRKEMDWIAWFGLAIWIFGFGFEVIADRQKTRFRANPDNKGKFIQTGLWAWSRHPNYFGEIVLWFGAAIIALPVLRDWQWVTAISPFFVAALITFVSGLPMLEKKADETWGERSDYRVYKEKTPALFPFPYKRISK